MEFKSKLIAYLSQQPGMEEDLYFPLPSMQANGKLESSHRFTKDCIHTLFYRWCSGTWDQLLPFATAAFNWFPNEHSQESPHFLHFGSDHYLPHLAVFLQPKLRYLGSDKVMICLDKLRQAYKLAALNTRASHSKQSKQKYDDIPNYKIGDLVMIRNLDNKSNWDAKYIPYFGIVWLIGARQLEVSNPTGRLRKVNVCDVHKILPSDQIVSSISDEQVFGRRGKYINGPYILKELAITETFLYDNFPYVRIKHK